MRKATEGQQPLAVIALNRVDRLVKLYTYTQVIRRGKLDEKWGEDRQQFYSSILWKSSSNLLCSSVAPNVLVLHCVSSCSATVTAMIATG